MSYASEVLADAPLVYYRLSDTNVTRGTVDASSFFSSEPPANAFDGNPSTFWTTNGTSTGWLRLQCGAVAATGYTIRRRDDIPNRNAKTWTFEGSNDGTTWTVLDTRTGITWPTSGETKAFSFANSTTYTWYRLNVTANNGDQYLSVAELVVQGVGRAMTDSSGNGRHGSYSAVPTSATGLLVGDTNTALNASSAVGTIPFGPWMDATQISLEFLINGTAGNPLDRDNESTNRVFQVQFDANRRLVFLWWDSVGAIHQFTSTTALTTGTVYHVAITYDGTTARLYLNGVLDGSAASAGTMRTPGSGDMWIAAHNSNSQRYTATIDEVAYYGAALSPTRVTAHANAATSTAPAAITGTFATSIPGPTLAATGTATAPPAVTGTVAASIPAPSLAATGTYTPPGVTGTLAGAIPAPVLALSGTAALPAVAGIFAGTIPAPSLSIDGIWLGDGGSPITGTSTAYANEGYSYTGTGLAEYDPPVMPVPPSVTRADVRRVHVHMPAPTLVKGRPQ